jgi:hypothetical protein
MNRDLKIPSRLSRRGIARNSPKSFAIYCSVGTIAAPAFSIFAFSFSFLSNYFRFNTYDIARKCCEQRTYGITKFLRINTYEKTGVGGCYC